MSGLSAILADLSVILCKFWGVNFGRSWRNDGQKMAGFHRETKKKQFEGV